MDRTSTTEEASMATESVWSTFEQVLAEYPELSFEEELRLFWNAVASEERIAERERGTGPARRWRPNRRDNN
jgi:hypothetical protein